jgi:hypothetical protein
VLTTDAQAEEQKILDGAFEVYRNNTKPEVMHQRDIRASLIGFRVHFHKQLSLARLI